MSWERGKMPPLPGTKTERDAYRNWLAAAFKDLDAEIVIDWSDPFRVQDFIMWRREQEEVTLAWAEARHSLARDQAPEYVIAALTEWLQDHEQPDTTSAKVQQWLDSGLLRKEAQE
jgi:hypothetical protein